MIIPIRTEMTFRHTPVVNYAILGLNIVAFAAFNLSGIAVFDVWRIDYLVLQSDWPSIHQFFTYQFLHADGWHLAGNMLFLWVFGNSVNAKLGDIGYALFYLAGGVFAAIVFVVGHTERLLGASGAIAAVTTAYLVLFPRSHVTVLFIFFFITAFEVPALILIGIKIVLWDNVIAPGIHGQGNIAISAHLGGYLFGFAAASTMLLVRVIPRDHFDLLALMDRWNRRRAYRTALNDPQARRVAEFGTVARPVQMSEAERKAEEDRHERIIELRSRIHECVGLGDIGAAAALVEELMTVDPHQCLSANDQMAVAREFYATGRLAQAARAYENYLAAYRTGFDAEEIRLLLGIIYARDLKQYDAAEVHLMDCANRLKDAGRRQQCQQWLEQVRRALGKPVADA